MSVIPWTRQSLAIAALHRRVSNLALRTQASSSRSFIDQQGIHSKVGRSRSDAERFMQYGQRRHETLARLCALFELTRDHRLPGNVRVTASGAVWQAFPGTADMPACHTAPSHLDFNGGLPTLITPSLVLRRHMIVEFADCMLMPGVVNDVDSIIDADIGRELFAATANVLLNERGTTWREGVDYYRDGLRAPFSGATEMYTRPGTSNFKAGNAAEQHMLEMVEAYYEGLFLHSSNVFRIDAFKEQVEREMGAATQPVRTAGRR